MEAVVVEVFEINQPGIGASAQAFKESAAEVFVIQQQFGVFQQAMHIIRFDAWVDFAYGGKKSVGKILVF
ncbi:hypothetical protein P0D91_16545 [Pseudomonas sp. CBSPBW29]|nr:hypothetical protein P0D91_16545 [Pseudomonas sp. CBSPBW29]WEL73929.1 hypothetical protein P0D94_29995 [Pseudomonas sp. CBSPCGW29]WEL79763.1 hypothetical protein P0D92_02620 [Pseudomonas sp. CBSPAW29]WEL85681.1 hypothetical protein P0D95_09745 [Pseudomonas sp. CBSPCAW29]